MRSDESMTNTTDAESSSSVRNKKRINIAGILYAAVTLIFLPVFFSFMGTKAVPTAAVGIVSAVISVTSAREKKLPGNKFITKMFSALSALISAVVWIFSEIGYITVHSVEIFTAVSVTLMMLLAIILYPLFRFAFVRILAPSEVTPKKFMGAFVPALALHFTLLVYLPADTYTANVLDFAFPIRAFIFTGLLFMILFSIVNAVIVTMFREKIYRILCAVNGGLAADVYIQYMFMNNKLKLLDGATVPWEQYTGFTVVNAIIWIAVILAFVVISLFSEKIWNIIKVKLPGAVCLIQAVALGLTLIMSGRSINKYRVDCMSGQEQYTLSSGENIVVFILDAVDNKYLKELLDTSPDIFAGFEDFTMYTNTCSVFDSTPTSLAQMYTGMGFEVELPGNEWFETAWNSERTDEFFGRLHNAGYTVNAYNFDSKTDEYFDGLFDNYRTADMDDPEMLRNIEVNKPLINGNFLYLSLYRALPFGLKKYIDAGNINFYDTVVWKDAAKYYNEDFYDFLDLELSDDNDKFFVTQHIHGTHNPCPDKTATTKYLMFIMREYINQMKALGVYDNSTIIITSDHGEHNDYDLEIAGTPIFLIKNKNVTGDSLSFNAAPISHKDFQATILSCAGLYDKMSDADLFGQSIFDIAENAQRERCWYDRAFEESYPKVKKIDVHSWAWSGCNVYYGYKFTGDTSTLEEMAKNHQYTIYPMTDNKG